MQPTDNDETKQPDNASPAAQTNPTVTVAGTPYANTSQVYPSPSANMVGQPTPPSAVVPNTKPSWKLIPLVLISIVLVVAVASLVWFLVDKHSSSQQNASSVSNQASGPTPLENKLSAQSKAILDSATTTFYLPAAPVTPQNLTLVVGDGTKIHDLLNFSYNEQFGEGLTDGAIGFTEYPYTKSYNPPSDCGLGDITTSSPLACTYYSGSKTIKAYVYNQAMPGAIMNTSVKQYINLYGRINNTIIVISSVDTDAQSLYGILDSMTSVTPRQLPDTTQVYKS